VEAGVAFPDPLAGGDLVADRVGGLDDAGLAEAVGDQQDEDGEEEDRAAVEDVAGGGLGQDVVHGRTSGGRLLGEGFGMALPPWAGGAERVARGGVVRQRPCGPGRPDGMEDSGSARREGWARLESGI